MEFTADQKKIIEARDCNILVSAAAGSGKTAVLVERILQLITDDKHPVDVDSLLVVTFTRAAAAQMRDKISKAINTQLEVEPGNINLQRQAALVHNAQITTIDSFCQYVLRNSFADIDLDPGFRLADEGEMHLLIKDSLDAILEEYYVNEDEAFLMMSESLSSGSDDSSIEDIILQLYETAMSDPWPEQWLRFRGDDYASGLSGRWYENVIAYILGELRRANQKLEQAKILTEKPAGPYMYGERIEAEIETVKKVISYIEESTISTIDDLEFDELAAKVDAISFDRLPACKDEAVDSTLKDKASDLRRVAKEIIASLMNKIFYRSKESHLQQMTRVNQVVSKLVEVTLRFKEHLDLVKREKGVLSFADCEHLALDILVRRESDTEYSFTETAREYRRHFSYVMIDEYQDSNLIQELILSAVSGESEGIYNRFMVGDLKQSIYRFRQADPSIFIEKYNQYDENSDTHLVVDLHQNFRSRRQVLDATNFVFEQLMTSKLGGVDYDEKAALYLGANYPEADSADYEAQFNLYDCSEEEKLSSKELEAKGIATTIDELMLNLKVQESENKLRNLRYGDIVILLRAANSDAESYKKALEQRGIPVHVTGNEGYFTSYEIQTILHLLRIIVNPLQDISFYGVLSSCIGGFTPEDIATIKILYRRSLPAKSRLGEGYLYLACQYVTSVTDNNILRDKVTVFLDMLNKYRDLSEFMPVQELLSQILIDTHYRAMVLAMRGGEKRLANVDMLIKKAADYSQTSYFGLHNFLRYIDTIRKYDIDAAEAETIDENADVVRIMSIHKSKGLEFPVCFLAGMGKQFNKMDTRASLVIDHELGIGIKDTDPIRRIQSDTLRRLSITNKTELETLAEELRILYVAMTRAKEKLIITGAISKPEEKLDKVQDIIVVEAKGFYEWLLLALQDSKSKLPIKLNIIGSGDIAEQELGVDIDIELLYRELEDATNLYRINEEGNFSATKEYVRGLYEKEYPYSNLAGLYTKTSVSELKHAAMPDEDEAAFDLLNLGAIAENDEAPKIVPKFISGTSERPGATVRGSAFHRAMELLDFTEIISNCDNIKNYLVERLDTFLEEGALTKPARAIFDNSYELGLLENICRGSIMKRMAQASANRQLYKEAPFIMGLPATALDERFPEEEMVLIQGIIDVYWIEEDGAVILDYKTDRVKSGDRLALLYKAQLDYYEQALTNMGIPVKEKLIYSFALDEVITL